MSDFTKVFDIALPAGKGVMTPVEYETRLGLCTVEEFLITFPPGCAGLVGAAIFAAHSPAYPNDQNAYLAFDDYVYVQPVSSQIDSGDWSIMAYNVDYFPHTLQIVAKCNNLTAGVTGAQTLPAFL